MELCARLCRVSKVLEKKMSDYERYGDYNDIEDDLPKSKNPVLIILKILTAIICIGVVGLLGFRLFIFNNYPDSVEKLYFNDVLTEHYNANGGNITVKTQKLLVPYDDNKEGNFFCDYLYLIDEIDQLQITVRYNKSLIENLSAELGVALDDMSADLFSYSLVACNGKIDDSKPDDDESNFSTRTYNVECDVFDSDIMYRYHKLVFDGVEFDLESPNSEPYWMCLEIKLKDHDNGKVYKVFIYRNNAEFNKFDDYKLSSKERP